MAFDNTTVQNLAAQIRRVGSEAATKLTLLFQRLNEHVRARGNVHGLTATDINLGRVPNYAASTRTQAIGGVNNTSLMTPKRANEVLEENVYEPIGVVFRDAAARLP